MRKKLNIEGMHCENCVRGLRDVLTEDVSGVKVEDISLEGGYAIVDLDENVDLDSIKSAVAELEFTLTSVEEA